MAQKGLCNLARTKALQDRGALLREEGDTIREFHATHEVNFPSSWLRKSGKGKTKREMERKRSQGERRRWNGCQEEMCEPSLD